MPSLSKGTAIIVSINECKKIGALGYITKPFEDQDVLDTVNKFLGAYVK